MNISPYVKAGYSILYIVTSEESRADAWLAKTAFENKRNLYVWSFTEGFSEVTAKDVKAKDRIEDPIDALNYIKNGGVDTIYIMRDFHMFFNANKVVRLVRDISRDFKQQRKTMIIVSPVKKIPPELERDITVIEFDLPGREDIETTFRNLYDKVKSKLGEFSQDDIEKCIQAAMGLTVNEAENAFAKSFIQYNQSKDVPVSKLVMNEKANAVKKSGILEYFDVNTSVKDVGGLENLKEWLSMRSKAFSKAAREFGLPMPRGILLAGLPGCGKSLSAKAASNILGVPLLRFDIGRVFGGLVGESLSPNEEIIYYTNNGIKRLRMEDAYLERNTLIGSYVSSFTKDMKHQLKKVDDVIRHKRKGRLVRVTTTSGRSVDVTEDHSLFSIGCDGKLKEVSAIDLKEGLPIAIPNGLVDIDHVKSFNLIDLIKSNGDEKSWFISRSYSTYGDKLKEFVNPKSFHSFKRYDANISLAKVSYIPPEAMLCSHHSKTLYSQRFILTEDLMELFGWFLAEGSFTNGRVRLSIHKDELGEICNLIKRCGIEYNHYHDNDSNGMTVFFGNTGLGLLFKYLGFDKLRIPAWVYGTSIPMRRAFVRGLMSGDGGISGRNHEISQANPNIIYDLQSLLHTLQIHSRSYNKYQSFACFSNDISDTPIRIYESNPESRRLCISTSSMIKRYNETISYTIEDKRIKSDNVELSDNGFWIPCFDGLTNAEKTYRRAAYHDGYSDVGINGDWINEKNAVKILPEVANWDVVFEKVASVSVLEEQPEYVYDISVEDNHNFISGLGGIICHNSERNMRSAIQTAEAVGNCVLWIDEMEKAFAGMGGSGSNDGGTSQRVFGNFITWMQEKTAPCFIIATVNRIDGLPPELLRKGRFDETFFVGLPSNKERAAIFNIHLQKYGRKSEKFSSSDIEEFVKLSEGFSGAEIEESVVSGLYSAFHHERELNSEDIIRAIKTTNPLSKSKATELNAMGLWAEENAINASRVDKKDKAVTVSGRQLDL